MRRSTAHRAARRERQGESLAGHKHSVRLHNWGADLTKRFRDLRRQNYRTPSGQQPSVAQVFQIEIDRFNSETAEQTIARLGLIKDGGE